MEASVDKAFQDILESDTLSTWSEKLIEYNGYEEAARLMLNELSKTEVGLSKSQLQTLVMPYIEENPIKADTILSATLNMLERDGYLMRSSGGIRRFRSPLLRQWWHYHFVE